MRNECVAHGRTSFVNCATAGLTRVLSRKWYMRTARDAVYKHVPGMFISPKYRLIFPELFGDHFVVGEWRFDEASGGNVKVE